LAKMTQPMLKLKTTMGVNVYVKYVMIVTKIFN